MGLKDTCTQYTDVPVQHPPPRVEPRRCSNVECVISLEPLPSWRIGPPFLAPQALSRNAWMNRWSLPKEGLFIEKLLEVKISKQHQVSLETLVGHRSTGRGRYLAGSLATDQAVACFSRSLQNSHGAGMALLWHTLLCSDLPPCVTHPAPSTFASPVHPSDMVWAQRSFLPESLIDEGSKGAGRPGSSYDSWAACHLIAKVLVSSGERERPKCNA